jgi:hypothetical protein
MEPRVRTTAPNEVLDVIAAVPERLSRWSPTVIAASESPGTVA